MSKSPTRAELEGFLSIDRAALDDCLQEQPEVFYRITSATVAAVAERDAIKLELEETMAQLDQDLRKKAAEDDEKLTEAALQNRLRTLPKIQAMQRTFLEARKEADAWLALKEAFIQRSYMLKELVALFIAQRHDLALESGSGQGRAALAESNRVASRALRKPRRAE